MNKNESKIMKGVAILLMVFLHLFNRESNVNLCHNLVYISGIPLTHILTRAANPVSFYLILGGYGLYKVWEKGDRHRWSRMLKLLIHYWIILLVFVAIGHFMYPTRYPGSILKLVKNLTGFHTTYNGEMWFLLPYLLLSALSPLLFRLVNRLRWWQIIGGAFVIHLATSFCLSRYGVRYLYGNQWLYNPFLVLHLMFSFFIGAVAAREHFFEKIKDRAEHISHSGTIAWGGVILSVVIACLFRHFYGYAFLFITFFYLACRPVWVDKILADLGGQSMNMWMIHTWLCYYLFHSFFYGLKYPMLIFVSVVIASYGIGKLVDFVAKPFEKILLR